MPDLSDTQVIIYTTWMGRSPDLVEDQVTYPIVTTLLSAPRVTGVRGFSDFGYSYVYVLFEDGTDIYWARSRVLEYMNQILGRLPDGVTPQLGPDATSAVLVMAGATDGTKLSSVLSIRLGTLALLIQRWSQMSLPNSRYIPESRILLDSRLVCDGKSLLSLSLM